MDYLKLEYFYRVAQYEHITKAAQSLHISQPALTKMIKLLEKECGTPLFYKVGRNIRLTEFGQHLKKRLDEIVPKLDGLAADLEDFRAESQRKIRLNVLAASTFVTDAVICYQQQNTDADQRGDQKRIAKGGLCFLLAPDTELIAGQSQNQRE